MKVKYVVLVRYVSLCVQRSPVIMHDTIIKDFFINRLITLMSEKIVDSYDTLKDSKEE